MLELGKANTFLCAKVRVSTNGKLICPKSKINQFPEPCGRYKAETGGWRVKKLQFTCRWLSLALWYRALLPTEPWISAGDCSPGRRDLPWTSRGQPGTCLDFGETDVKWGRLYRGSHMWHTLEGQKRRGRGSFCQDGKSTSLGCDEFSGGVSSSFTLSLCSPSRPITICKISWVTTPPSAPLTGELCKLFMKHHRARWSHTAVPPADLEGNRGKKQSMEWKKAENYCLCTNKTPVSL